MRLAGLQELLPDAGPNQPGYHLEIAVDGESVFAHSDGAADLWTGEPVRGDSIFYVGSVAKQFVAACVALLWRDGLLDMNAPITNYVDDLPAWWSGIHLQHLLHHTGGLPRSYRPAGGIAASGVPAWGNEDLLVEVRAIPEPIERPGAAHVYAGDGYLLLAEAVAQVSGTPLGAFAHQRLFEPLGMRDTFFRHEATPLPARAARGHFRAVDGALHVEPARFHAVGSGGLWTTAADLATWDAELPHDRLTGGWLADTLTTPGRLGDGRPIHYAWGVSVRTHRGLPIVSHGGTFPGWESKLVWFREQRTTVVCLANSQELDVSALTFAAADHALGDVIDPSAPHADRTFMR